MTELQQNIKKMIIQTCRIKGVKPEQIMPEDAVIGGMGAAQLDSLDAVEIATSLERHFGLRAEDMPLRNIFSSYTALSDYLAANAPADKIQKFNETFAGVH